MPCAPHRALRAHSRLGLLVVLVGGGLALVLAAGTEFWVPATPAEENEPAAPARAYLHEPATALMRGAAEKRRLALEVADGRLGLLGAAAQFRAIDRQTPQFSPTGFRSSIAGASDEERYCREVIGYVRSFRLSPVPDATDRVARLEAELRGLLDRGEFELPAVPAAGPP